MRRLPYLAPLLAVMALGACETVQGAGRDMQTAGQMITQQSYANSPQYAGGAGGGVTDPYATQQGF